MSLTALQIVSIAKISQYLAENDIEKKGLYGGGMDLELPTKLYCVRENVEWMCNQNQLDDTLFATSTYLYALCGKYGIQAQYIVGTGGSIAPPISPSVVTPVPIEFLVSASSTMVNGQSTLVIPNYINYNLLFLRNNIPQSSVNLNDGSAYFSWDKITGTFTCYGAAVTGDLFQLYPFM